MSVSSNEDILRKVRGLLAQAENSAATPAEAEAFSRKAEEMIAKYAVDVALLEAKSENRGKPTMRKYPITDYGKAKSTLLTGIAYAHSCKVIRSMSDKTLHVYGFESDLALVDMLYTSLLLQGQTALLKDWRTDRSFRTSFWYGFAARVYKRLEETQARTEREAVETSSSTALVLADRKSEVDAAVKEAHPRLRTSSPGRVGDRAGFGAGKTAADRADLGGTRLGGARRAIS